MIRFTKLFSTQFFYLFSANTIVQDSWIVVDIRHFKNSISDMVVSKKNEIINHHLLFDCQLLISTPLYIER